MPTSMFRVLVVDEHPVVRQGVRALLESGLEGAAVTDAPSLQAALDGMGTDNPDVTIVDPWRAGGDVESVLSTLTAKLGSPIVVFTAVVFALPHYLDQRTAGVEQALISGLVFGTIFARTEQIFLLMVAHAAFDLAALAMIYWEWETAVAHFFFK